MDLTVAVFDVDGTLTVRDCVVPFSVKVAGLPGLASGMIARTGQVARALVRRDRDAMKSVLASVAFSGHDVARVESMGVEFADRIHRSWMRSDVAERLRWHQENDHVVLLVSASFEAYLLPLGDLMEVDAVLGTRLVEHDGLLTGEIEGSNCRGPEKVRRIAQWCEESGVPIESIRYAYGDSSGDQPMLELAEHAHRVDRIELERCPS